MIDPDEAREEDVLAELRIRVRRDGAMSVAGDIHDLTYALAMLRAAEDSIKSHHNRKKLQDGKSLITPSYDTPLRT